MDYFNFDSEVIESLNLLTPPVERHSKKTKRDKNHNLPNNVQVLGKKFTTKHTKFTHTSTKHGDSSTSLVLKKTSERQILKHYSVVNYTNLHAKVQSPEETKEPADKDKPLIKVTVIPNSDINTSSKILRKQRIIKKTIKSTSSNHENSIHTKNLYLVVAGRKKEKIYEIKTTGSAKLDKESKDDIENIGNFHQFLQTFNMEKKRKKDSKKDVKSKRNEQPNTTCENAANVEHLCDCTPDDVVPDVRPGKSRVRIFGRLGLTGDDRYVLKCQATVNDEPVLTSTTVEQQQTSDSQAFYNYDNSTTDQIDCIMQTDFRTNAVQKVLEGIDYKNRIRKESQSTQVNFNCQGNGNTSNNILCRTTEQDPFCNYQVNNYPVIKTVNTEYETENLKPCQSPLVIISVFPKQNNVSEYVKTPQFSQIESPRVALPECNQIKTTADKGTDMEKTNSIKRTIRSRSPSPDKKKTNIVKKTAKSNSPSPRRQKTMQKKVVETIHVKNQRNISPVHSSIAKTDQTLKKDTYSTKQQTLQFFNSNAKKEVTKPRAQSPSSPKTRSPCNTKNEPPKSICAKNSSKPISEQKADKAINTEHLKAKKALVDSYTKSISKQMSFKEKPRLSVSKVSVNIDSENEYYDVCFRQDKFNTDLNVRKTMKEAGVQKFVDEKHGSLENFFPNMSKRHLKNSFCQQANDVNSLVINRPRTLTLRDSLEISHRREDKEIKDTQTTRPNETPDENSDDMGFLAPVKHFTGDDCTICDPIKRDREIRELLGVGSRKKRSNADDLQSQVFAVGDQLSRHCFYPNQCKDTLIAGLALDSSICPCFDDCSEKCDEETEEDIETSYYKYLATQSNCDSDLDFYIEPVKQSENNHRTTRQDRYKLKIMDSDLDVCVEPPAEQCEDICNKIDCDCDSELFIEPVHQNRVKYKTIDRDCGSDIYIEPVQQSGVKHKTIDCECDSDKYIEPVQQSGVKHKTIDCECDSDKYIEPVQQSRVKHKTKDCKCDSDIFNEPVQQKGVKHKTKDCECDSDILNKPVKQKGVKPKTNDCECGSDIFNEPVQKKGVKHKTNDCDCDTGFKHKIFSLNKHNARKSVKYRPDNNRFIEPECSPECLKTCVKPTYDNNQCTETECSPECLKASVKLNYDNNEFIEPECSPECLKTCVKTTGHDTSKPTTIERKTMRKMIDSSSQYEGQIEGTSLYQQLTLNRNVQIFLQLDQFSKQKPIVLSRKQYNKVKKTIQNTISGKEKRNRCICNQSIISVGQYKDNTDPDGPVYSQRGMQTDKPHGFTNYFKESKKYTGTKKNSATSIVTKKNCECDNMDTVVLFSNKTRKHYKPQKSSVRQAVSSVEVRYASVAYMKQVTFSSTNVGSIGSSSFALRNQHSIETLFRGHKKSLTPNLGTSALSLESGANISKSQSMKVCSPDVKTKKPFLKRLLSCLVMRSKASEGKVPDPVSQPPSVNSSVDSYHISTSFGAIEMTSSLYDTSASFYSDHSIHPLSSKLKRSFFSSVRGFLTSRKS